MPVKRGRLDRLQRQADTGTSLVDPDEERARVDQEINERLAAIPPSSRLFLDRVRDAIPDTLVRRLEARKPGFIIAQVASQEWRQSAFDAVFAALEAAVRTDFMLFGAQHHHIPADDIANRAWQRKSRRERTQYALSMLASGITVVTLAPGEELEPAASRIADMVVDLTAFDVGAFEAMISGEFPNSSCNWPSDLNKSAMEPRWIDLAIGRSASADEALQMIAAIYAQPADETNGPRLEDLYGYKDAGRWGQRLVTSLCDYRAGQLPWIDVDAGALIVGPPGTGKTLFAGAIARSAAIPFFPTSYAAWQSVGEGHLGTVLKEMRRVFSDAALAAPSLVFIDEVDTLQARGSTARSDDWWRAIINALLEVLDGTGRREGVIVIAACNDDMGLDPALVRAGRLDRKFFIGLPDEDDLRKILSQHLPGLPEADIEPAALTLAGSTSGADAARIARDVRQRARNERRGPTGSDLLAVALPPDDRPQAMRRRIAIHEAGHAVAILCQGTVPNSLSIATEIGGKVSYAPPQTALLLPDLSAQLAIHLAGRAAEEALLGSVSAGSGGSDASDLGNATRLASLIEGRLGLGCRIGVVESIDEQAIERRLRVAYAEALLAAMRERPAIEALAELALEKRVLGKAALAEFWRTFPRTISADLK